jgi:hypothetical protein
VVLGRSELGDGGVSHLGNGVAQACGKKIQDGRPTTLEG